VIEQERFRKDAAAAEELVAGRLEAPAHDRGATGRSVDNTPEESTTRSGEFDARAREVARAAAQGEARPAAGGASTRTVKEIGPVVTLWIGDPTSDGGKLAFVRRVRLRDGTFLQGFVVDWDLLQADLLEAVGDLFSEAELVPVHRPGPPPDRRVGLLATVPAVLEVGWTMRLPVSPVTPTRIALIVGWLAACSTIVAAGIALRRRLR